ncbi:TPA: hypothetical protein ACH3X1_012807 [Trebouxia sp. C0004]
MSQQECVHHNKLEEPATESKCGRGRQSATVVFRHQGMVQQLGQCYCIFQHSCLSYYHLCHTGQYCVSLDIDVSCTKDCRQCCGKGWACLSYPLMWGAIKTSCTFIQKKSCCLQAKPHTREPMYTVLIFTVATMLPGKYVKSQIQLSPTMSQDTPCHRVIFTLPRSQRSDHAAFHATHATTPYNLVASSTCTLVNQSGRQVAAAMLQRPCGAPGLHQELKKGKGKSSLCAEQAVAAGVGASFRANLNQQGAVQLLEDSAGQLGEARIQKLDAQHKLKQKEVEALLSKRDAGRMAYLLRNRDAQVAYLERRVQRLVSALRPYTCCCKKGACITGLTRTLRRQEVAAKRSLAYVKQTATKVASLQTQAQQHELAA